MLLPSEFRQRLAKEYRYAATKMQQAVEPARKLYYFSVVFGESQRVLNWKWDQDLALITMVTQQTHSQINTQGPLLGQLLPIDAALICERLTQTASDLASYFEEPESKDSEQQLCSILGRFAAIGYAATGNGSYLYEKGILKL